MNRPRLIGWSIAIAFGIVVWVVVAIAIARADSPAAPTPAPAPPVAELVPRAKLVKAVRARDRARAEVRALRAEVRTLRASLHDRDAYRAEGARYRAEFLCIASHESHSTWDVSTGNGYYGGLQMDRTFARGYGPELYFRLGTPDHWTEDQQIAVASRAVATRGFTPWPNTARMCGLL